MTYHFGNNPAAGGLKHEQFGSGGNTLCGSWPAYLRGEYTTVPSKVTCRRCATRLASLARSLTNALLASEERVAWAALVAHVRRCEECPWRCPRAARMLVRLEDARNGERR